MIHYYFECYWVGFGFGVVCGFVLVVFAFIVCVLGVWMGVFGRFDDCSCCRDFGFGSGWVDCFVCWDLVG